eukprot:gene3144-18646_t
MVSVAGCVVALLGGAWYSAKERGVEPCSAGRVVAGALMLTLPFVL